MSVGRPPAYEICRVGVVISPQPGPRDWNFVEPAEPVQNQSGAGPTPAGDFDNEDQ